MAYASVVLLRFVAPALIGLSCSGSASGPPPLLGRAEDGAPPGSSAAFERGRWGTFHSRRFELSLSLPDGSGWKIDDHNTRWLKMAHAATRSRLWLRKWSEDQLVTRKGCYERAREWESTLPDLEAGPLIDDGMRRPFEGLDARVAVGVRPGQAAGAADGGFVVAAVGEVRRCIVVVYQTEADGQTAPDAVAGRLAVVADRLLPSVKFDPSFAPAREPSRSTRGAGDLR
jgi:hypothetical protein